MTRHKPPLMDFTYLYDSAQADFTDFTAGRIFTEEQVYADIDSPENWTHREGAHKPIQRTEAQTAEIADLLARCLRWGLVEE